MKRKALIVAGVAAVIATAMVAGSLLTQGDNKTAEAGYYVFKCVFNWARGMYECRWYYVNTCVTGGECP